MKKILLSSAFIASALLAGCIESQPQLMVGRGVLEAIEEDDNPKVNREDYQDSVESIRRSITDDEKLYEFVAALSLIRSGVVSQDEFLSEVHGLTPEAVIALGKRDAFYYMMSSFRNRISPKSLRENLNSRLLDTELPPEGTLITIDNTNKQTRDQSVVVMLLSCNDEELYELTAALDIISAMSIDELAYADTIADLSADQIINLGRKQVFQAAVNKTSYNTPAHLLRGELPVDESPESVKRLDSTDELTQVITSGEIVAELSDEELYEFITAMDILRVGSSSDEEFNSKVNGKSSRELVRETFYANQADFLQTYAMMKQNFPPLKLQALRAEYVAKSVVLKDDNVDSDN